MGGRFEEELKATCICPRFSEVVEMNRAGQPILTI